MLAIVDQRYRPAPNRSSKGRYWGLRLRGNEWQVCQGNRIEARYPEGRERAAFYHVKAMMRHRLFPGHPE